MKISIITISYNSSNFIARNIESVNEQTYSDVEHVFVDNLSTDQTVSIIRTLSKRDNKILCEKDRGISDAFNKGIKLSKGDIIGIINSDDTLYSKNTLLHVYSSFTNNPEVEFIFGDMAFMDPTYGSNIRKPLLCPITKAMPYNHPSFFVKRSFYEKIGLFDEAFRYAMDFELISRMYLNPSKTKMRGFYFNSEPLSIMYAGGASWKYEINALLEVKKAIQRRGFWNLSAQKDYFLRLMRVKLKFFLDIVGMRWVVKSWRFFKWKKLAFF